MCSHVGETLNHLKEEEQGLTHNDTMLLAIFLWLWGPTLGFPSPTGGLPGSGKFEASEFVGMEGLGTQKWEVYRDHGNDGRVERNRKDSGKGTACKHRLLFQGPVEESCDPSGISDETVETITNNTPTGAREYTKDIFSCWTLTHTYVHWFILWKMLHFLLKKLHQAVLSFFFFCSEWREKSLLPGNVEKS